MRPHFVKRERSMLNITTRNAMGNRYSNAVLTPEQVVEIRRRYATGAVTQRQLAAEYGISEPTVSVVVNRKRWKDID